MMRKAMKHHPHPKGSHPPRDQPFMDNWLDVPEFKGWLTKRLSGRKMKPYCSLCEKFLTCSKTGVKRHKKHQENSKAKSGASSIGTMMTQRTTANATTSMEVKLCAFVTQHNLPTSLTDDML